MTFNLPILIILPTVFVILFFLIYLKFIKNRKRSAKNIYKLIDDLEKKYIY